MYPISNAPEQSFSFNQQSAGFWNRRLILQLLNGSGALSRRQIAERTGILGSTVAYIVRDLLKAGLVKVEGKGPATGVGRRNILLGVNREYGWGVGISLLHTRSVRVELLNSGLRRLDATVFPVEPDPSELPAQLVRRLREWLDARGRPPGKFLGVGVGLPGVVDVERNVVLHSMRFGYRDFPLGERMAELLGVPVRVEHNAHLGAHAEAQFGCAARLTDFVYLLMNRSEHADGRPFYSYGASLHLSGETHRGACFAAGELDRATIPKMDLTVEEAEELAAMLADEKAPLTALGTELAKVLGRYLAPVVDLIDPEALVLGGDYPLVNRLFLSLVEDWIRRRTIALQGREIKILPSELGQNGVAIGAALRVVENELYGRELVEQGAHNGEKASDENVRKVTGGTRRAQHSRRA